MVEITNEIAENTWESLNLQWDLSALQLQVQIETEQSWWPLIEQVWFDAPVYAEYTSSTKKRLQIRPSRWDRKAKMVPFTHGSKVVLWWVEFEMWVDTTTSPEPTLILTKVTAIADTDKVVYDKNALEDVANKGILIDGVPVTSICTTIYGLQHNDGAQIPSNWKLEYDSPGVVSIVWEDEVWKYFDAEKKDLLVWAFARWRVQDLRIIDGQHRITAKFDLSKDGVLVLSLGIPDNVDVTEDPETVEVVDISNQWLEHNNQQIISYNPLVAGIPSQFAHKDIKLMYTDEKWSFVIINDDIFNRKITSFDVEELQNGWIKKSSTIDGTKVHGLLQADVTNGVLSITWTEINQEVVVPPVQDEWSEEESSESETPETPVTPIVIEEDESAEVLGEYSLPFQLAPGQNAVFTSAFGGAREHEWVDLAMNPWTRITSVRKGKVHKVKRDNDADGDGRSYGHYIEIDHGYWLITRYAHLQQQSNLKKWDPVSKWQIIWYSGESGSGSGPHLDFEYTKIEYLKIPKSISISIHLRLEER